MTIPAVPEQVRVARSFVAGVLGPSHECLELAVLLASELVTNSVLHSGSARGGLVTLTVTTAPAAVRVEVTDLAGDTVPVLSPPAGGDAESSRGMRLVNQLAWRWGYERGNGAATTWFEVGQPGRPADEVQAGV